MNPNFDKVLTNQLHAEGYIPALVYQKHAGTCALQDALAAINSGVVAGTVVAVEVDLCIPGLLVGVGFSDEASLTDSSTCMGLKRSPI